MTATTLLETLLNIDSPTYQEAECISFCHRWIEESTSLKVTRVNDNLIATSQKSEKPHIAFIGHLDTVPKFFKAYQKEDALHGSGASDMKGGIAAFLWFIKEHEKELSNRYQISIILYSREEGTQLKDNGLYELIQEKSDFFKTINLGIVAEPTNNVIQLGCVGSIHTKIRIIGKHAHSARPWNGENALYKAIPVIQYFSQVQPVKHKVFGVTFTDVLSITESETEKGRTTVPSYWEANLNFRYAPVHKNPERVIYTHCQHAGITTENITLIDHAPAGSVIETPLFNQIIDILNCPIEPKQAWTDVAQLTQLGIPAFNFGPGLTKQAHQPNEYIQISMVNWYINTLKKLL